MNRIGRELGLALLTTLLLPLGGVMAQGDCLNVDIYPPDPVVPSSLGEVTLINDFSYETEHSQITNILSGANYEFTLSSGGYITVRVGTYDGPVLGQGSSPVQVTTTGTEDLFAHWNTDESCGTATIGVTTTVQLLLNCTPPTVSVSYTEDCDLGTFSVLLDVISLGDAATVNVIQDLDGQIEIAEGLDIGIHEFGPFTNGLQPEFTVAHDTDPLCNVVLGALYPFSACPYIVDCASGTAIQGEYCYANDEAVSWLYQSSSAGTLRIQFYQGAVAYDDPFVIYDGPDNTGSVLFTHDVNDTEDLSGMVFFAASGSLFMELTSNAFTSCDDGGFEVDILVWEVSCGSCELPTGSASVEVDCPSETYTINVDVTGLGDAATAVIVYTVANGAPQTVVDLGVGVAELGPFPNGDSVHVVLQNADNDFCSVDLGSFVDPGLCPNLIVCGAQPEQFEYCYEPSDSRSWLFTSVGTGTLRLRFLRGTIESNNYDSLRIYDGVDDTAPLVFVHDTLINYNLGPAGSAINNTFPRYYTIDIFATGNSIYMDMGSDGSVQCGGEFPSATYDRWEWEVVCLDCDLPQASYTVVDDCANEQFSIPIEVTSTGDGSIVNIVYIVNGGDPQTVIDVAVGMAELGPFALNDTVNVVVEHESSSLCNIQLGNITDTGECPLLIDCGTEVTDGVCYNNSVDLRYYYQGTGTFPLGLFFDAGLLFFGDSLIIYDGGNINAPQLYAGTNLNVTDLFVNTTNPEHLLTIRVKSNEFTSCVDGFEPEALAWRISCLDCVPVTATFTIVQDCENEQYFIAVDITELGSDPEAQIANTFNTDTLAVTETGTYQIGPFPTGTELAVTVVNDANSLCNVYSGNMVNPLCPVFYDCPGPTLMETYCYSASDTHAWAYELVSASSTTTLRLTFVRGTIERSAYDKLRIYDGPDNTSPLLFEHTGIEFFPYELGPTGSAVLSTGGIYYGIDVAATGNNLYMEMTSDGSVQCGSTTYDPWEWEVYCLDCTNPTVLFNVVPDCLHRSFGAEVIVTEVGGTDGLTITNTLTGEEQTANEVGVFNFGPYPVDSIALFQVHNSAYEQCRAESDTLTYASEDCISVTCGFDNYSYCYENDEDRWYTFQAAEDVPITIAFLQGQMLPGDSIKIYNGRNENAPLLFQGNNGGDLTGFSLNSSNAGRYITLRIKSNSSGSCEDGQVTTPLAWNVSCGAISVEELAKSEFKVYPNPTQGVLQIELGSKVTGPVQLRVLDMSGRTVLNQPLLMNGGTRNSVDMRGLQSGNYMVQLTTSQWVKTQRVQLAR
ncbi:MAG TPA: T9SS type A sorting domain-containing protein [Flavobacteriales bacterium]|jgi:hypothetical protein|nr:T9SS type A sorting domain-containing protein [Flavobacteriales bacterium]MBK7620224.1 T9SS type A sorting domain-containing protein [Flavobacteriales bacterium]MBP9176625.1 T9SS type A sorting domain-containing protein [Flavobacteriales bacterium]HQW05131.1 T9SS type A sorting domain-containing protein [Flavobacteriales bacterium]HQY00399.1 T9SS type A sorting domain-containing protein [Flavobacteriales bacterium]